MLASLIGHITILKHDKPVRCARDELQDGLVAGPEPSEVHEHRVIHQGVFGADDENRRTETGQVVVRRRNLTVLSIFVVHVQVAVQKVRGIFKGEDRHCFGSSVDGGCKSQVEAAVAGEDPADFLVPVLAFEV